MNDRQRAFAREYLIDLNGKAAAIRAGYKPSTADNVACGLLKKPEIAALVAQGTERRAAKKRITADRVMEELGRVAFADIRNFIDWGPEGVKLRRKTVLDAYDAAAIADVEGKGSNGKIGRLKLYDKLAALNALAKHLGMIGGRTAVSATDHTGDAREARAELRARLMRIVQGEEDEPEPGTTTGNGEG
jgi:phage terminase small subunit